MTTQQYIIMGVDYSDGSMFLDVMAAMSSKFVVNWHFELDLHQDDIFIQMELISEWKN